MLSNIFTSFAIFREKGNPIPSFSKVNRLIVVREKKKRKKNTKSEKKERNEQRGGRARLTNERRSGGWEGRGLDGSTRSSGVGHGAYPRRVSSNENSAASNEFVSSVGGKSERERERE